MNDRKATPEEFDFAKQVISSSEFWQKAWNATLEGMRTFEQLPEIYADFAATLGKPSLTDVEKKQAIINHVLEQEGFSMVETKEQWEEIKNDVRSDISTQHEKRLVTLIEALREIARVAENALTYDNVHGIWTLSDDYAQDMQEAYARIPDWITDD